MSHSIGSKKCPTCKAWLVMNKCGKCGFSIAAPTPASSSATTTTTTAAPLSAASMSSAAAEESKSSAKPRKNSFTFWQEKEAEKLEAERKAERERRFGDISRESYARLVIASNSIAKLSGRGSAGPSRGSSQQQQQQQQITRRTSSKHAVPATTNNPPAIRASLTEKANQLEDLLESIDDYESAPIYDNSDPFAADLPPPPMVSLTGEPQLSQDDAAIEAMLANLGTTMSDGTFVLDGEPVYEFAPPKALTPPPAEASVPATLRDAVQFLNDCRNKPADAAQTLLLKRRKRHDGQMLEFVFEGELAHMKTKEGAAGCDDAVAALKRATPVPSLVFSAALCDACDRAYEPKRTGKTTDALEIVRNNGRLRGTAQQMTWRGKFSDPLDAMMALFVDDGNSDRSRRAIMRLESARYGGIAWGEDGQDHYLVVVLAESFADK